jgi:O-antigen/teichoic acid export membrane protein
LAIQQTGYQVEKNEFSSLATNKSISAQMKQMVQPLPTEQLTPVEPIPTGSSALLLAFGRNTFWLWIDRGVMQLGTLVMGLLLVRYLGPAHYGMYTLSLSVGSAIAIFTDLGITRYAARAIAASPVEAPALLATELALTTVLLVVEVIALSVMAMLGRAFGVAICAGMIVGNLLGTVTFSASVLVSGLRSRGVLVGSFLSRIGSICVVGTVIWRHLSVQFLLLGLALVTVPVLVIRLRQLRSYWPTRQYWRWKSFSDVVIRAGPFFSYSVTQVGYEQVSVLCLGAVASREAVGWFAAALVIADVFPQWTFASVDALVPLLTRLFEAGRIDEFRDVGQRLLETMLVISVPIVLVLAIFAPELCRILGARFSNSALVLRIVSYRALVSVLRGLVGQGFLTATNLVAERRNAVAKVLVMLAGMTLLLGRLFGPAGAAMALLIADSVLLVQYVQVSNKAGLRFVWKSGALAGLIGGTAMIVAGLVLPEAIPWTVRAAAISVAYVVVLFLFAQNTTFGVVATLRDCVTAQMGDPVLSATE